MSLSRIRKFYQNIIKVDRFVLLGNLFLVALFFVSYEITKEKPAQTDKAGIQLTAKFRNWSSNPIIRLWKGKPEIVLTFVNPTEQSQTMAYPYPMHEYATEVSHERPLLCLLVNKASSSQVEDGRCFVLSESGPATGSKPKVLTLKPGETVEVMYKLTSFYLFGMGGPNESKRFIDVLTPGKHKVAVRAVIAYSELKPFTQDHLESPPVILRCDFRQDSL